MSKLKLIKDLGMMYPTTSSKQKSRYGIYLCECGAEVKLRTPSVKSGNIVSCGCHRSKILNKTTHGMNSHRLYKIWNSMINRCENVNSSAYKNYGARGITVCNEWKDINVFIKDMYPTYKNGLQLDRADNNSGYNKENCRWATSNVQSRNTRKIMSTNKTGYRGVVKKNGKFQATIGINNRSIYLGIYETAIEASKAYDNYVKDNNLEHTINGV